MFGFVMANVKELEKERQDRYLAVYCGICREIRERSSQMARFGLSYDMAFLSLLLMSLYEPEEQSGTRACHLHPIKPRTWVDNKFIQYGADMNVALSYYKALDDYQDDGKRSAKRMAKVFGREMDRIRKSFPRQCKAIADCIDELAELESSRCPNPDKPAGCFGKLMAELFVYKEDMWSSTLREMGMALGRFIYLADAAIDDRKDKKKNEYNPYLAMGMEEDWDKWDQYLVMAMGRCTDYFERLPLVQDKDILDNILYSGIWLQYRSQQKGVQDPVEEKDDPRSV